MFKNCSIVRYQDDKNKSLFYVRGIDYGKMYIELESETKILARVTSSSYWSCRQMQTSKSQFIVFKKLGQNYVQDGLPLEKFDYTRANKKEIYKIALAEFNKELND
jgi:hypothetical protein